MGEWSARVRRARAELRAQLRLLPQHEGRALLAELIADPPDWLEGIDIDKLLRWPQRVYGRTAERWLAEIEMHDRRPLRRLTPRQRNLLSELLRGGTSTAGNEGRGS